MEKRTDNGRTKFNTDNDQFEKSRQQPKEEGFAGGQPAANYPQKSDQDGKFSPQGKQQQGDWDNSPGEESSNTGKSTPRDSQMKGDPTGVEGSGGV
jgi:hypothetical protein